MKVVTPNRIVSRADRQVPRLIALQDEALAWHSNRHTRAQQTAAALRSGSGYNRARSPDTAVDSHSFGRQTADSGDQTRRATRISEGLPRRFVRSKASTRSGAKGRARLSRVRPSERSGTSSSTAEARENKEAGSLTPPTRCNPDSKKPPPSQQRCIGRFE
ncbi:MAG: hypothetical protein CM1200mP18_10460 [Gammaproteobacteria bacterium]|nr:MAG: hypothetical protein CM1200mP18_10460 [Gammaproteobacteria bacterium]